jgi:glucosyl-dolichyl phosphate glucuronosyltransferase
MYLSVIIPTRNRAKLLNKVLGSILNQTYSQHNFEIIVVDNGSTDETREICSSYEQKISHYRYIYDETPGLHIGRHAGLKAAQGKILVYADDDIRAFPTWLEGIAEAFKNPQVALVGGKNIPDFEIEPPDWVKRLWIEHNGRRSISMFSVLDFGDEIQEISPLYVWGCNFSIRKSVLQEIGGFHPDGMPKDRLQYRGDGETTVSLAIPRLGYKTVYNPKASVYHWVSADRMTLSYIRNRAFAQGISDSYTKIRGKGIVSNIDYVQMLRFLKQKIKRIIVNMIKGKNEISQSYEEGFRAGYHFHQKAVKNDPELLRWVLKEHYLD